MKKSMIPANVSIMDSGSQRFKQLRQVTTLDIYEGATRVLHPEGLFSTQIFGRVGAEERDTTFARVHIGVPIFDPTTFDILMSLKGLYLAIINETKFAVFDEVEKDFVASDPVNGDTGYDFFFKHWDKIQFTRNNSDRRNIKIQLLEKYKKEAVLHNFAIMPAGMRDIETNEAGRLEENEINEKYRRVIAAARVLSIGADGQDLRALNAPRRALQRAVQEVWQYIFDLVGGKRGYMAQRMASRRIFDGTRNVITAMDPVRSEIGKGEVLDINKTQVGIFQTAKGLRPLTIGIMRRVLMENVFEDSPESTHAWLIDPKTMERKHVNVGFQLKDRWTTKDGLGKIIESFREDKVRQAPIKIASCYLGLIYEKDHTFKLFWDIKDLPEGFSRANVRPINLTDLMYLNCVDEWNRRYTIPTRYPVAGAGSVYPTQITITSTVPAEQWTELNSDWQVDEASRVITSYPVRKAIYYDSMSIHPARLEGMAADHDGDMASSNFVASEEGIKELDALMNKASTYLNPQGGLKSPMSYYTVDLITHNMSRR